MDVQWVQRRSWHAIREPGKTLCGLVWHDHAARTDTLPAGRSCETCLRIIARRADKGTT